MQMCHIAHVTRHMISGLSSEPAIMICHGGNFLTGHDDNYVDDGGDFVACCTMYTPSSLRHELQS